MRVVVMLYEYHFTHSYRPESFFFLGRQESGHTNQGGGKGGGRGLDWTGLPRRRCFLRCFLSGLAPSGLERLE